MFDKKIIYQLELAKSIVSNVKISNVGKLSIYLKKVIDKRSPIN